MCRPVKPGKCQAGPKFIFLSLLSSHAWIYLLLVAARGSGCTLLEFSLLHPSMALGCQLATLHRTGYILESYPVQ